MKNDSVETRGLTCVNCVNFQSMWITVFCRCLYVFLYKRLFPKLKALMQHIYVKGTNMSAVPYPVLGTVMFPVRGWMLLFLNSACIIGTLRCSTVRRQKDNQWGLQIAPWGGTKVHHSSTHQISSLSLFAWLLQWKASLCLWPNEEASGAHDKHVPKTVMENKAHLYKCILCPLF